MILFIIVVFEDDATERQQTAYAIGANDEQEAQEIALQKAAEDEIRKPRIDNELSFACLVAGGTEGKVYDVILRQDTKWN